MISTWTHGIDNTHGIDLDSWYNHFSCKDSLYRHGLMVLTTLMVLPYTHGVQSVLLNHICMRALSVAHTHDFFLLLPIRISKCDVILEKSC